LTRKRVPACFQDAKRGESGEEENPGQSGASHQAGAQAGQGARHQVSIVLVTVEFLKQESEFQVFFGRAIN
jgi:hypothetical protein